MLLGAHAYYYTSGKVPDRVDDHAAGFQIPDTGRRQGSVIYDFAVAISASAIWDLMKA